MSVRSTDHRNPHHAPTLFARIENVGRRSHEFDYRKEEHVALYRDAKCTDFIGFTPWWHRTKPTRRHRHQMLNCARYRLVWLAPMSDTIH